MPGGSWIKQLRRWVKVTVYSTMECREISENLEVCRLVATLSLVGDLCGHSTNLGLNIVENVGLDVELDDLTSKVAYFGEMLLDTSAGDRFIYSVHKHLLSSQWCLALEPR